MAAPLHSRPAPQPEQRTTLHWPVALQVLVCPAPGAMLVTGMPPSAAHRWSQVWPAARKPQSASPTGGSAHWQQTRCGQRHVFLPRGPL